MTISHLCGQEGAKDQGEEGQQYFPDLPVFSSNPSVRPISSTPSSEESTALDKAIGMAKEMGARIRCRHSIEKKFEEVGPLILPLASCSQDRLYLRQHPAARLFGKCLPVELHLQERDQGLCQAHPLPQSVRTLWKNYVARQKKIIYASDDIEHWLQKNVPNPQHFASFVGAESTVLVIKDKTENLPKWIRQQEFRKFSSSLLFCFVFVFLREEDGRCALMLENFCVRKLYITYRQTCFAFFFLFSCSYFFFCVEFAFYDLEFGLDMDTWDDKMLNESKSPNDLKASKVSTPVIKRWSSSSTTRTTVFMYVLRLSLLGTKVSSR